MGFSAVLEPPARPPEAEAWIASLRPRIDRLARFYARLARVDADDLRQEAWVGLLEGLRDLDPTIGSSEEYLYKRARWRLLDALKRARRNRAASLEQLALEPASPANPVELRREALSEFEGELEATQRAILACLLLGHTWREAGQRLGCTSANVAYHMRQIRARYARWDLDSRRDSI